MSVLCADVYGIVTVLLFPSCAGHASRWGESTTSENWFNNTFPSLAGVAEKLWSPAIATIPTPGHLAAAETRVKAVLCRMLRLGLGPFDSEYGPWPFSWCGA